MSPETAPVAPPVSPVNSLNDPRALQILSTEPVSYTHLTLPTTPYV